MALHPPPTKIMPSTEDDLKSRFAVMDAKRVEGDGLTSPGGTHHQDFSQNPRGPQKTDSEEDEDEPEVDSRDDAIRRTAMHHDNDDSMTTTMQEEDCPVNNNNIMEAAVSPALISEGAISPADEPQEDIDTARNLAGSHKPALTLSAFRRPAARLTQADPRRKLETYYDLHVPNMSGVLGHGAFSTVRLAVRRRDRVPVAIKCIAKHEALRSRRLRVGGRHWEEWEILRRMRHHPYILSLLDVLETDDEIQIVTEYCQGGELFDAIQRKRNRAAAMRRGQYSETQAACICSQVLRSLEDLHRLGVVHRDIKPENLLLSNKEDAPLHVKLCDFGMARCLSAPPGREDEVAARRGSAPWGEESPLTPGRSRNYSMVGSNFYVAPEVCFGSVYGTAVDIYSLGVTLYILLCGFPPVFASDNEQVMFPETYWKDISESAKALVRKMLDPDPTTRITATDALHDDWVWEHQKYAYLPGSTAASAASAAVGAASRRQINLDLVRHRLKTLGSSNVSAVDPNKHGSKKTAMRASPLSSTHKRRQACRNARGAATESSGALTSPKASKKHCAERRSSTALLALADLYRDVAQSPSAKVLAAATMAAAASSSSSSAPPSTTAASKKSVAATTTTTTGEEGNTPFGSPVRALSV